MDSEPGDQEFKAVLQLPEWNRYQHFLKRIVDFDRVWMAEDEQGLITVNGHDGEEVLPVWPARRYAQNAMNKWPDFGFVCVSIADWLEKTLRPAANADDCVLAVFPDPDGNACVVLVPDMISEIEYELSTRLGSLPDYDPDADEIDLEELLRPAMRASTKTKPKGRLP